MEPCLYDYAHALLPSHCPAPCTFSARACIDRVCVPLLWYSRAVYMPPSAEQGAQGEWIGSRQHALLLVSRLPLLPPLPPQISSSSEKAKSWAGKSPTFTRSGRTKLP